MTKLREPRSRDKAHVTHPEGHQAHVPLLVLFFGLPVTRLGAA